MLVVPAIDIKDGKCIRLLKGDFDKATVYGDYPLKMAGRFMRAGARCLHLVDLDGAKAGKPVNKRAALEIIRKTSVPVQVGGGIRTYQAARTYLDAGASKVILGTSAIQNPDLLERLIKDFGSDRIMVAADIKNGRLAMQGWTASSNLPIAAGIATLKRLGVVNVLVTDVSRDGTLDGPNFGLIGRFVKAGFQVTAAGGISKLGDVAELNKLGVSAAVAGKAVYEDALDLKKAQAAVVYKNTLTKRIIPCLDVKDGKVVKGTNFTKLKVVGQPVKLAEKYSRNGADELVFLDVAATLEGRKTFRGLVADIAKAINVPFTVGGGISSIGDIRSLLAAGADKVSLGTAAAINPGMVRKAAEYFGSQCIVISVDAKREGENWVLYIKGGAEPTTIDVLDFCEDMKRQGAGELLVNSLDRDGTDSGFDLELLRNITDRVDIPVIASSGGGSPEDFARVFQTTGADAALGASIFHYRGINPSELKQYLSAEGVEARP